jgi:hypothetical protein
MPFSTRIWALKTSVPDRSSILSDEQKQQYVISVAVSLPYIAALTPWWTIWSPWMRRWFATTLLRPKITPAVNKEGEAADLIKVKVHVMWDKEDAVGLLR